MRVRTVHLAGRMVLLLFALLWKPAQAQQRVDLDFRLAIEGNRDLSSRRILRLLVPGSSHSAPGWSALQDSLLRFAADYGHPFAAVRVLEADSSAGSILIRTLELEEGPALRLGRLKIEQERPEWPGIREYLPPGLLLSRGVLQNGFRGWLEEMAQQGRALAGIHLRSFDLEVDPEDPGVLLLDLQLDVRDEGILRPRALRVPGSLQTRARTLRALTRLQPGEDYDPDRLKQARRRLLATGWFEELNGPGLCRTPEGIAYLLEARERPFYRIDGMVGWLPGRDGASGRFAYHGELDLDNLSGTGRSLHLLASRPDGFSQDLALSYHEAFLFGSPLGAGVDIRQSQRDSSWVELSFGISADAEVLSGLRIKADYRLGELNPDSLNGYLRLSIDRSRVREFGLELLADQRDDPRNPVRGWLAGIREGRINRRYSGFRGLPARQESSSLQRHEAWTRLFLPLRKRLVVSPVVQGGLLTGDEAGPEDRFLLGGVQGPRGSAEHSIQTSEYLLLQLELRYLLGPASRVALFWDQLRWLPPGAEERVLTHGRGAALVLPVRQGQLELVYALQPGVEFGSGTLHVRLFRRF